jgi:hypothetical protein
MPDKFYLLEVANLLLLRMEQLTKRMLADPAPMEIEELKEQARVLVRRWEKLVLGIGTEQAVSEPSE